MLDRLHRTKIHRRSQYQKETTGECCQWRKLDNSTLMYGWNKDKEQFKIHKKKHAS